MTENNTTNIELPTVNWRGSKFKTIKCAWTFACGFQWKISPFLIAGLHFVVENKGHV